MELFDAAIFGELLWSAQQHHVAGGGGVVSAGGDSPASSQPRVVMALGDGPCLLLEGFQQGGHSDVGTRRGASPVLIPGGWGIDGWQFLAVYISVCMPGALLWVSQEAEGRGWRGSSRPGTGVLSQLG